LSFLCAIEATEQTRDTASHVEQSRTLSNRAALPGRTGVSFDLATAAAVAVLDPPRRLQGGPAAGLPLGPTRVAPGWRSPAPSVGAQNHHCTACRRRAAASCGSRSSQIACAQDCVTARLRTTICVGRSARSNSARESSRSSMRRSSGSRSTATGRNPPATRSPHKDRCHPASGRPAFGRPGPCQSATDRYRIDPSRTTVSFTTRHLFGRRRRDLPAPRRRARRG